MYTAGVSVLNVLKKQVNAIRRNVHSATTLYNKADDSTGDKKTALYDFHVKNGGKMVSFANHLLPVQYSDLGVSASHLHTRSNASLFDVSHMLQTHVKGKECIPWIETICPLDIKAARDGSSTLTVFLNENGGILDDLIVTKINSEYLYIVSNAGRMEHDKQHMLEYIQSFKNKNKDVDIRFYDTTEKSLIALQGPRAAESLQKICVDDLSTLYFMNSKEMNVAGVDGCRVTRCGYTGEDGFEISMPSDKSTHVCDALLQLSDVKLAGLGARDSLRLEAGLCLYGNDIDDTLTPIEANLAWLIPKSRRIEKNFIGADVVTKQIKDGVTKRRVGLRMTSGPPARRGAQIIEPKTRTVIGKVTSGCPSPFLGGNVAMGYVNEEFKKPSTDLLISIRNNLVPTQVAKMPFVPAKYYNKK